MSSYTESHGFRAIHTREDTISKEMFTLLFECCKRYFINISWKYYDESSDESGSFSLDYEKICDGITLEIPKLYIDRSGTIDKPQNECCNNDSKYDEYAIFDLIELIAHEARDTSTSCLIDNYRDNDSSFTNTREVVKNFTNDINSVFNETGCSYILSRTGVVEKVPEYSPLTRITEESVTQVLDKCTRELLEEAIGYFKDPNPEMRSKAVEKIWSALESVKSHYGALGKRLSLKTIISNMSGGQAELEDIFNEEFRALSKIGRKFCIRDQEANKLDITDNRYYDYFFNRCLSIIALAIQYLEN